MDPIKEIVGHQVKRTAGVVSTLAIVGIIGFICWSIYAGVIKPVINPNETMKQTAEKIQNNYITESDDRFFIGVKVFGLKIGLSKSIKVKVPSTKDVK